MERAIINEIIGFISAYQELRNNGEIWQIVSHSHSETWDNCCLSVFREIRASTTQGCDPWLPVRRACYTWEFARCIIFWLCLFVITNFPVAGNTRRTPIFVLSLFDGFRWWYGCAFSDSFVWTCFGIILPKVSHSIPQICQVSPQGIHTCGVASSFLPSLLLATSIGSQKSVSLGPFTQDA